MHGVDRSAWRALFAAQIGWMLDSMDFLLFTFAVLPIQKEFAISKTTIGLLTSVALIASAFGGIVFGRLADRIGRVRAMTWSILIYSGATAGLASASALWQLLAWRMLVGVGMGGEWSSGSVLVAETWPAEHRAKAMGIMQSGWAIGAIIAAALSVQDPRDRPMEAQGAADQAHKKFADEKSEFQSYLKILFLVCFLYLLPNLEMTNQYQEGCLNRVWIG